MDSGDKPSVGETASLVRHGLALRLFGPHQRGVWRAPLGTAAVLLSALLGMYGFGVDVASASAAYQLEFHPDPFSIPAVDPFRP